MLPGSERLLDLTGIQVVNENGAPLTVLPHPSTDLSGIGTASSTSTYLYNLANGDLYLRFIDARP